VPIGSENPAYMIFQKRYSCTLPGSSYEKV
jgi:hypothetical protein